MKLVVNLLDAIKAILLVLLSVLDAFGSAGSEIRASIGCDCSRSYARSIGGNPRAQAGGRTDTRGSSGSESSAPARGELRWTARLLQEVRRSASAAGCTARDCPASRPWGINETI